MAETFANPPAVRPTFRTKIGSQPLDLPVVPVGGDNHIALMITVDLGIAEVQRAGAELAELLREYNPDIVITPATMGIPLAIEVSRALGINDYVVLQKSRKLYLQSSPSVTVTSITTDAVQTLTLDHHRVAEIAGKRVLFVDDVLSTGASAAAGISLIESVGGHVVGVGAMLHEGDEWRTPLAAHTDHVHTLGFIPFPVPANGSDSTVAE